MQFGLTCFIQDLKYSGLCNEVINTQQGNVESCNIYNKGFHFVRSAVKLNLVMSCSKVARHQIPCNSAEPNEKASKPTTLIDATTLLD